MRVVLVLGTEALTTKQIQQRLPDVAQASLYRAVSRLVDAGVIAVVAQHKRGGAIERVYRVADAIGFSTMSSTPEEFVAAAQALARSVAFDAARHAASDAWSPESAALLQQTIRLSPEQFKLMTRQVAEMLSEMAAVEPRYDGKEFMVSVVAIPRTTSDDGHALTD